MACAFVLCLYDCPQKWLVPPTDAIGLWEFNCCIPLAVSVTSGAYLFQRFVSSGRIGPSGCRRAAAGRRRRGGGLRAGEMAAPLVEPLVPNALQVRQAAQIFERLVGEGGRRQQETAG